MLQIRFSTETFDRLSGGPLDPRGQHILHASGSASAIRVQTSHHAKEARGHFVVGHGSTVGSGSNQRGGLQPPPTVASATAKSGSGGTAKTGAVLVGGVDKSNDPKTAAPNFNKFAALDVDEDDDAALDAVANTAPGDAKAATPTCSNRPAAMVTPAPGLTVRW